MRWFFEPEFGEEHRVPRRIWLGVLGALVMAVWGYFLNFGSIPLDFHDWAEVNAPRLAFLKDAVTRGVLPLHMNVASALRGVTDRFMAIPDVILSPQILLLRWMSVGTFVLVHTWLMIGLGYWGLLRLRKRLELSLFSFTWIVLLFYFNGHILSHYAVGHITWGGYFLLGWFADLVFALIRGERGAVWEAKMAFLLFIFFLQGSFHQFVWCVIFLGFLAISNWKLLPAILRAGIGTGLLSAVRIIPPAMQMGTFDNDFLGGYRSVGQIISAFTRIVPPADSLNWEQMKLRIGPLSLGMGWSKISTGWWEFDLYTGIAGLILLLTAGIFWLMLRDRDLGFPALLCPMAVLGIFSLKNVYLLMRSLRIPLFSGERLSSRFLIIPFVFLLIAGTASLQRFILKKRLTVLKAAGTLLLIPAAAELWRHLEAWKVTEAVKGFPVTPTDLSLPAAANHPDSPYTNGLLIGCAISLAAGIILIVRAKKQKRAES